MRCAAEARRPEEAVRFLHQSQQHGPGPGASGTPVAAPWHGLITCTPGGQNVVYEHPSSHISCIIPAYPIIPIMACVHGELCKRESIKT